MEGNWTGISVVAENLSTYRVARRMTQSNFAEKTGLTQAGISHLERGLRVPTVRTLARLADALGTVPQDLLTPPGRRILSRHEADRLARSILRGAPLPPQERDLAAAVGSLAVQKLRTHHVPGRVRYARHRWAVRRRAAMVKRLYGESVVNQILQRLDALLAMEPQG